MPSGMRRATRSECPVPPDQWHTLGPPKINMQAAQMLGVGDPAERDGTDLAGRHRRHAPPHDRLRLGSANVRDPQGAPCCVDATLCGLEGGDHRGRKCVGRGVAAEIRGRDAACDRLSDAEIEQPRGLATGLDPAPLVEPVQQ